jgi:predicted NUDIX family NTP pyrophosphohydrolase
MTKKISAGILLFRINDEMPEVLLVHPGGPFWKNKDDGAWSIPKGEALAGEELLEVAKKEFFEETGTKVHGNFLPLEQIVQKGGKTIYGWAVEGDIDVSTIVSNTFSMIWPPKSGKIVEFPEVDTAGWFDLNEARLKLNPGQVNFIIQLQEILNNLPSA